MPVYEGLGYNVADTKELLSRDFAYAQRNGNGSKQAKNKRPVHRIPVIRGPIGILFRLCPQTHQFDYLFILIIL
jgi:hypothetical protein